MPFIKNMIRERRDMIKGLQREASAMNWSRTRYLKEKSALIRFEYKDKGLTFTKKRGIIKVSGAPDVWQMFRYYREQAINKGQWDETPRKKRKTNGDNIRIDKGDVRAQKARRKERQREIKRRQN